MASPVNKKLAAVARKNRECETAADAAACRVSVTEARDALGGKAPAWDRARDLAPGHRERGAGTWGVTRDAAPCIGECRVSKGSVVPGHNVEPVWEVSKVADQASVFPLPTGSNSGCARSSCGDAGGEGWREVKSMP